MSHEVEQRSLARYLEEHNLKQTRQREAILEVFLSARGHITSEDLYQQVRARHPHIGYTTAFLSEPLEVADACARGTGMVAMLTPASDWMWSASSGSAEGSWPMTIYARASSGPPSARVHCSTCPPEASRGWTH